MAQKRTRARQRSQAHAHSGIPTTCNSERKPADTCAECTTYGGVRRDVDCFDFDEGLRLEDLKRLHQLDQGDDVCLDHEGGESHR